MYQVDLVNRWWPGPGQALVLEGPTSPGPRRYLSCEGSSLPHELEQEHLSVSQATHSDTRKWALVLVPEMAVESSWESLPTWLLLTPSMS